MSINKSIKQYNAKLCFLLDVTGSMDPVIAAVQGFLLELLSYCESHYPSVNLEVGFVGYRDVDSGGGKRYELIPFTSDMKSFKTQFSLSCACTGGGDEAEDVLGGMQQVLDMDWDHRNTHVKVLVHCGDSPHHGSLFHDPAIGATGDSHPELEASPRSYKDILADFADFHIDYNFAQIKCHARNAFTTSRMLTLFADAYNSFPSRRCDFAAEAMENFTAKDLFAKVKSSLTSSIRSFMRSISTGEAMAGAKKTTAPMSTTLKASNIVASGAGDALDVLLNNLRGGDSKETTKSVPIAELQKSAVPIPASVSITSAAVSIGGIRPILSGAEATSKSKTKISPVSIGGLLALKTGQ